jgi:hypothetical protein
MIRPPLTGRRRVAFAWVSTALTGILCAGLVSAAALVPAPPAVLPLIAVACVGCPLLAGWDLRAALARHRPRGDDARALAELRRRLDALPETRHPLGL